ncbi:acyl-CoA dehydrogenase family protein [Phytohabitans houttuyneae]|uniref:Acyl-CoA dehydrogenase n=2 Tax=Phytohabitans houttuyneae TaxID=1076126 RepID=A0A6V8KJN5_9ACTN|nr:acyl-CoA dehydrogenase [Phytohabitans houttuyneae]
MPSKLPEYSLFCYIIKMMSGELRDEVRRWCATHVPPDWRREQAGAGHDEFVRFQRWWFNELKGGGYAFPHWPGEWGGGYDLARQAVIFEELARADAPRLVLHFVALHHAAATLFAAGTEQQRARHLPAIRDGEIWCQGFSEPDAGSDLASLRTRAERRGDVYVVNGQKIWASGALDAAWCLLLARTDPSAPKRRGISYLIMDMRAPGVTVRPIRQITGEQHFCEIFLTDVEIPVADRVGAENDGWRIAQSTLNSERGGTMIELAERLAHGFEWLVELAARNGAVDDRLARLASEVQALRLLVRRPLARGHDGAAYGAFASTVKLFYSELLQRMTGYGVELSGLAGQERRPRPLSSGWESGLWLLDYIGSWEWTIPGGTSEIQRNIIGERGLGLPREALS